MIIARRTEERCARPVAAWDWLERELVSLGVRPTLFGSLAKERFRAHSDIDVTVDLNGKGRTARLTVDGAVSLAHRRWGVQVDLLFEDDLTEESVERMLAA